MRLNAQGHLRAVIVQPRGSRPALRFSQVLRCQLRSARQLQRSVSAQPRDTLCDDADPLVVLNVDRRSAAMPSLPACQVARHYDQLFQVRRSTLKKRS